MDPRRRLDALTEKVVVLYRRGQLREAGTVAGEAVQFARLQLGESDPDTAACIANLGLVLKGLQEWAAARSCYEEALAIREKALGPDHPLTGDSLTALALLLSDLGEPAEAQRRFEQALDVRRKTLGPDHPLVAACLNDISLSLTVQQDLKGALRYSEEAMAIRRRVLGARHPDTAASLLNAGMLHQTMMDLPGARSRYEEALAIFRLSLGPEHPHTASASHGLGSLLMDLGEVVPARVYLEQALAVRRKVLGVAHPDTASTLYNLGALHQVTDNAAEARTYYERAYAIFRDTFGPDHRETTGCLLNLGTLLQDQGDFAGARSCFERCLAGARRTFGTTHPEVAQCLLCLGGLCVATDRIDEAWSHYREAAAIHDTVLGRMFSVGSERQRLAYLENIRLKTAMFLSLVLLRFRDSADHIRAAFDIVLRRKGLGAEALAAQRNAMYSGRYPHLATSLRDRTALRKRIAERSLAGPGPEGTDVHSRQLAEWERECEKLEVDLVRGIPEMNLELAIRAADRRAVASALPPGFALVEFIRFDPYDFERTDAHAAPAGDPRAKPNLFQRVFGFLRPRVERGRLSGGNWLPARYLAFVLHADRPDDIRMIDLGEADPIDLLVREFREGISGRADTRAARDLGSAPDESGAPPAGEDPALRESVFDKLLPALESCRRLLLAPDGDLCRLPFEVLPAGGGRRIIDDYRISYVATGRDVLRFGLVSDRIPGEPLVVADPDFDLAVVPSPVAERTVGRLSRDLDRGSLHFRRLLGTRTEGERIGILLGVYPWLDATALEGRLKAYRSPRILHIATHGFFLPDQRREAGKEGRDPGGSPAGMRLVGAALENPLLRSGLALAGVNGWLKGGCPPAEAEDGLLTAEDVTGLDLLDTDLVVLSACDTGLGEIRVGEGVFGLRRAFVLAGAKTLVMSLWKVPDDRTQELMEDFYERISAGESRSDALRSAQLTLKARCPDPLDWGAFICQGEPGELPEGSRTRRI